MTRRSVLRVVGTLLLGVALLGACTDEDPSPDEESTAPRTGGITYGQWDEELGDFRIWVANVDGSDPKPLVDVPSWMSDWSPDGTQIVYEDMDTLQIVNADGTGRHEVLSSLAAQWIPEWSPTGEWIAFEGSRTPVPDTGAPTAPIAVWVVAPDGTGLREVLPGVFGVEPVFSPDGTQIAFGHVTKAGSSTTAVEAIEIVNLDGTGRHRVVAPRPGLQHVDWSVDNWLVFNIEGVDPGQVGPPDAGTLFAVRPDGSDLHVVRRPDDHFSFFKPIWSPDGSQILTGCHDNQFRVDKLCKMDSDGTHLRVVVSKSPINVNFPAWGASTD
jgi:Tol biopolymer transport system component